MTRNIIITYIQILEKLAKKLELFYKRKEKIENSSILKEYNREYKRMHGLHYNHTKEFKEKQFKEWSEKARELRDTYTNEQIEDFKIELKKLSDLYWKQKSIHIFNFSIY